MLVENVANIFRELNSLKHFNLNVRYISLLVYKLFIASLNYITRNQEESNLLKRKNIEGKYAWLKFCIKGLIQNKSFDTFILDLGYELLFS